MKHFLMYIHAYNNATAHGNPRTVKIKQGITNSCYQNKDALRIETLRQEIIQWKNKEEFCSCFDKLISIRYSMFSGCFYTKSLNNRKCFLDVYAEA